MNILIFVLIISLCLLAFGLYKIYKESESLKTSNFKLLQDLKILKAKFAPLTSLDDEIESREDKLSAVERQIEQVKEKFEKGLAKYKLLENDIRLYEEANELLEYGVYKPYFSFETSEKFKEAIQLNKEHQKSLVKEGNAAMCETEWTVGNSRQEGKRMTKKAIKLTLRAFNGECDALISKVKWNNIHTIEKRIGRSYETINKANESNHISIEYPYLLLKLDEARLTHEYHLKKHEEKEEQRAIREEMREEERANKEIEKAQKEAEKEERRYQKALEQAINEVSQAQGTQLDSLNSKILKLQEALSMAHEKKERALSRAQMTRSGHVYVISNLGSFGEDTFKIGMTRRLEPLDRVKELGDASVPFQFDIHALIYSDDAPALEAELHRRFNDRRVNRINYRKEYFSISIEEIEEAIQEIAGAEIEITKLAEAIEYRETLALLKIEEKEQFELEEQTFEHARSKHSIENLFN